MNKININPQNATLIIRRLKDLSGVAKNLQLAELLNIAPTTLSNWKTRDSVDYKLIIAFCVEQNYDLGYVLAGIEPEVENSQIENLATYLIEKIRNEIKTDIQQIADYKEYLAENLDKMKIKEEIQLAKERIITKAGNAKINQP